MRFRRSSCSCIRSLIRGFILGSLLGSIRRLIAALLAGIALASGAHSAFAAPLELLVPAYFYPEGKGLTWWSALTAATAKAPVTAIVNPNSGPDLAVDPAYSAVVDTARAAGVKVIGYVHTSYGARPLTDVVTDINRYVSFYAIDGIFIDEMADDGSAASVNYYLAIYQYIKGLSPNFRVIMNPGTTVPEQYASLPLADALVTFESGPRPYRRLQTPAWVHHYTNDRFGHLVHDVGTLDTAVGFVTLAQQRNAGLLYITNDKGASNPWNSLPAYWSGLVSEVCKRNGGSNC